MTDLYRSLDLSGKRILITGGLGFIGSNLARQCVQLGAAVTIYDSLDTHSGGNLYNIEDIEDSVELVYSDILNFSDVCKHIVKKDIVFNCAASTSHPFSMKEPWLNSDVNSRGVINLLEAARRFNNKIKFIHIGTSTQLGKLRYRPADELHPEFPTDIYSSNKSVSEKYTLIYGSSYGMNVSILRFSNVFGPRACIHSPEFTFINYFIGLALQKKTITVYGDGNQIRNLIYVDDCVSALILAANNDCSNGEVFFAAGDEHYSVIKIAETIKDCFKQGEVCLVKWPEERKLIEVGDAVITNAKIKNMLDWSPVTNLVDGLTKTKEYYDSCLTNYLR